MRRCFHAVLLALASLLASAQDETPVFKSSVGLVKVDAEITDGAKLLGGFEKQDFRILDNGTPQEILYFSQGEVPLDVILLFDLSGSMIPKLQKLAESAHAALAELKAGDRVAVMAFGSKTQVIEPFTEDLAKVESAINERVLHSRMGGTRILAAINQAAAYFRQQSRNERRRAVVIVTDNHGQISGKKSTAIHNLWEADAVLCGLQVRFPGETALIVARRIGPNPTMIAMGWIMDGESMTGVAEKTGGDLLKGADSGAQFTELMRRLRLRYSLYYALPAGKAGEERKIKVQLTDDSKAKNPQGRVLARSGYHFPKS